MAPPGGFGASAVGGRAGGIVLLEGLGASVVGGLAGLSTKILRLLSRCEALFSA